MNAVSVLVSICSLEYNISIPIYFIVLFRSYHYFILFIYIYIYIYILYIISQNLYNLLNGLRLLVYILINIWISIQIIVVGTSDVLIYSFWLLYSILWNPTSKESPPTFCLINSEAKE